MPKITGTRAKPTSRSKVSDAKPKAKTDTTKPKAKTTGWGPSVNTGGSESGRSTSSYTPPSYSSGGGE